MYGVFRRGSLPRQAFIPVHTAHPASLPLEASLRGSTGVSVSASAEALVQRRVPLARSIFPFQLSPFHFRCLSKFIRLCFVFSVKPPFVFIDKGHEGGGRQLASFISRVNRNLCGWFFLPAIFPEKDSFLYYGVLRVYPENTSRSSSKIGCRFPQACLVGDDRKRQMSDASQAKEDGQAKCLWPMGLRRKRTTGFRENARDRAAWGGSAIGVALFSACIVHTRSIRRRHGQGLPWKLPEEPSFGDSYRTLKISTQSFL